MPNGQASPTAKVTPPIFFFFKLPLKKPQNLKFIEQLSLLGECNG